MPAPTYNFGEFELDPSRFELRRHDRLLKLERIPMELLVLLLERSGQIVNRQEIIDRLWGQDVFVDTEHGINTAIRKIRRALRDDVEKPRFIQTVSGKGYRFVGEKNGNISLLQPREANSVVPIREIPPAAPISKRHWWPMASVAFVACLLAGAVLELNLGGTRDRIFPGSRRSQIRSIAVLPLTNLSGDPSQDYFADGMTDELITALAKNHSLQVVSRTSAMQYKAVNRPVRDIARELGVDGILEGSVERSRTRVHMTVQLIYAPSDTHIWAESYDRDTNEAFSLPSELSQTVAREIKIAVSPPSPQRYVNPDAHDAYLLGRYYWFKDRFEKSREYFQTAINLQPDYGAAWGGLADSYLMPAVEFMSPASAVMPQAQMAATKALELDDTAAEAHNSMALIQLFYRWNWEVAERESARTVELNRNLAEGHFVRSYVLRSLNRMDEALQEEKKAMELDPFSDPDALVYVLIRMQRFDAALNEARIRGDAQPNDADVHEVLSEAYYYKGMEKESELESERALQLAGKKDELAGQVRAYHRGGLRAVLAWRVDWLKQAETKRYVSPMDFAEAYARLGRKEETIRYLEQSYQEREPHLVYLQSYPDFDFLHADPRYRTIVKKMG